MGKDNSSSKSELRLQLEKTNELLKKTTESLEEAQRKIKEEERKIEDKNTILEAFLHKLVDVKKPNVLLLEHDFSIRVAPYLTKDEIDWCNELLGKDALPEKAIVNDTLTEKMRKYFNGILDELNQIIKFELYMENQSKVTFRLEPTKTKRLAINTIKFDFTVNIR